VGIGKQYHLEALIETERDKLLGILERMEDGILLVSPDYRISFVNTSMIREFGDGTGSYCYQHLHKLYTRCDKICRLP